MSYRQLWEGGDGASFLHRLDGRTKLSFLFLYALMMIIVDNSRTLFILFTGTFLGKRHCINGGYWRFSSCLVCGAPLRARRFFSHRIHERLW